MICFAIHTVPALISWSLRWNADRIEEKWPGAFGMPLNEEIANNTTFMDMIVPCMIYYGSWTFIYLSWLICFGRFHGKERTGYETLYEWDMLNYPKMA